MCSRPLLLACVLLFTPALLSAQFGGKDKRSGYDRAARATVLHDTVVYVSADDTSQKVAEVTLGHEVVVIKRSGPWVNVFANIDTPDKKDEDQEPEFESQTVDGAQTGWIRDKGVVTQATTNGDAIVFGAAAELEDEASRPHAPKNAASGAHLLYRRVFEYFPDSPLAGEAAWRSADIRWELEKSDISTLPSAKEQEAYLRPQIYEGEMKQISKHYPGSKYAAEAAFDLLDNKLCGDWQGLPKCPEMEARLYLKYVDQYPESPKGPEAEYNAIYREGVLVTMYQVDENRKQSEAAAQRTQQLADEMRVKFPNTDWTRRAQAIAFRIKQGISVYGSDRE